MMNYNLSSAPRRIGQTLLNNTSEWILIRRRTKMIPSQSRTADSIESIMHCRNLREHMSMYGHYYQVNCTAQQLHICVLLEVTLHVQT